MRGDTVLALVKVEFGDRSLGESPKVEALPEIPAEFNYNANLNVTFEDPITLDEIATKPVVCKYSSIILHLINLSSKVGYCYVSARLGLYQRPPEPRATIPMCKIQLGMYLARVYNIGALRQQWY